MNRIDIQNKLCEGLALRTVLGKSGYLLAVFVGWLLACGLVNYLINAYIRRGCPHGCDDRDATSYGLLAGGAQLFVAIFFFVWLRHVRRSEGGKVATRLLGVALIVLLGALAISAWLPRIV
jgi:hypothetical protein